MTHLVLIAATGGIDAARHGATDWREEYAAAHPHAQPWAWAPVPDLSTNDRCWRRLPTRWLQSLDGLRGRGRRPVHDSVQRNRQRANALTRGVVNRIADGSGDAD